MSSCSYFGCARARMRSLAIFLILVAPVPGLWASARLSGPGASPANLPIDGGAIALSVAANSDAVIQSAGALIRRPDGVTVKVPLALVSGSAVSGNWSAAYTIGRNQTPAAQTYWISFVASDSAGNAGQTP